MKNPTSVCFKVHPSNCSNALIPSLLLIKPSINISFPKSRISRRLYYMPSVVSEFRLSFNLSKISNYKTLDFVNALIPLLIHNLNFMLKKPFIILDSQFNHKSKQILIFASSENQILDKKASSTQQ